MNYQTENMIVFSAHHMPYEENQRMRDYARDPNVSQRGLDELWNDRRSDECCDTFHRLDVDLDQHMELVSALHPDFPHLAALLAIGFARGATYVTLDGEGEIYPWLKSYEWGKRAEAADTQGSNLCLAAMRLLVDTLHSHGFKLIAVGRRSRAGSVDVHNDADRTLRLLVDYCPATLAVKTPLGVYTLLEVVHNEKSEDYGLIFGDTRKCSQGDMLALGQLKEAYLARLRALMDEHAQS